jgi:lipoyl-dependent peroxiredoxin
MITKIEKVLLTGKTHTTVNNRDGRVTIKLSTPGKEATPEHTFEEVHPHPLAEELFAGAWSACFITALNIAAKERKVTFPPDSTLGIEVDMGTAGKDYFLQVRINVSMPGVEREIAEAIVHAADGMCVYSKATRGNISVELRLL